jgi:hypothetical protein
MNHSSNLVYRARHEQPPQNDLLLPRSLSTSSSMSSSPTAPPPPSSQQQQQRQFRIDKRRRQRQRRSASFLKVSSRRSVLVFSATILAFLMGALLFSTRSSRTTPGRNMRAAIHDEKQHPSVVRLDILERDGGMPAPPAAVRSDHTMPNYGKLQISFGLEQRGGGGGGEGDAIGGGGIRREIIIHDPQSSSDVHHAKNQSADEYVGSYYAFDDDYLRNPYQRWVNDTIQDTRRCRRVSWHRFVTAMIPSWHGMAWHV